MKHTLYLIACSALVGERPLEKIVKEAVAGGVDIVQLRERGVTSREVYDLARKIKETIKGTGARLLINDRVDIALAVGADGVHLGQKGLPVETVRRLIGHGRVIGVSTHDLEEAKKAENEGADYIFFSPVFATSCKPGANPKGVQALRELQVQVGIPVIPLGGINKDTLPDVVAAGITNAAVMSGILTSDDPKNTAMELKAILQQVNK